MCHIGADKNLEASILAELEAAVGDPTALGAEEGDTDFRLNVDNVRGFCPLLLAT
jgi:hypothetical protein